ncbi:MAG: DUF4167 domain-containing protein [Hyphomicrobiaceae bacterium]|nr:MAG: DUF4167 domain-containing protein [Hyphomicrobiaceae bacterium]
MRQGQQNRRGRGRNRKSQNPLSRSFESNGPDVKIRGTPAHIAEKYISLARDAQSSGDPVLAENYLQHAEHYSRIIMAYREQLQQHGEGMNGNGQRMRSEGGEGEEFGDEGGDEAFDEGFPQPPMPHQMQSHQPPRQQGYDSSRHDRPFRRDRDQGRFRDRDRHGDRDRDRHGDREGRPVQPQEHRPPAESRQPSTPQPERQPEPAGEVASEQPRRRDRFQAGGHEQPEFLRRPVRRARSDAETPAAPSKEEPSRD